MTSESIFLHRWRVHVLGASGAGKTSLIQTLVNNNVHQPPQPTEGIRTYTWQPFKQSDVSKEGSVSEAMRELTFELWDMTGREVCLGVHHAFLAPRALNIVVFNLLDRHTVETVRHFISLIQSKAVGGALLLVATCRDKVMSEESWSRSNQTLLQGLKHDEQCNRECLKQEIKRLSSSGGEQNKAEIKKLENQLARRLALPDKVYVVSCSNLKGIEELKSGICKTALSIKIPENRSSLQELYQAVLLQQSEGLLVTEPAEMAEFITCDIRSEEMKHNLKVLNELGLIMEVGSTESERLVCTNPTALADFACSLHLDDNKKSFQFHAEQFWPKKLGCKRPDPGLLVTALEEIPASGIIREVLLPLFWQGPMVTEDQLKRLMRILVDLGLLISHVCTQNGLQDLTMPRYGSLSIMEGFSLPLMDLYMDKRPQLNWTPHPFVGDIQINWVFEFPLGVPDCLVKKLLAVGQQSMTDHTYLHRWKYGVLTKYGEVLVCMEVSLDQVDICCRVNAEDGEKDAVRMLWIHLAKHILPVNHFLQSAPGLFYKVGLLPLGQLFYNDKKDSSVTFPLQDCVSLCLDIPDQTSKDHIITKKLNIQKTMPIRDGLETSVSDWLRHLSKQWKPPPKQKYKPRNRGQSSAEQTHKHKKVELKWGDQQSPSINPDTDHQVEEAQTTEQSDKQMVENTGDTKRDTEEPAPDIKTASKELKVSEEAIDRDRLRVASAFTAVVMATAVAEYIKGLHEDNHGKVSLEQVQAATLASKIAIATNDGNIDEAAQGVISAVKSLNPVKVKKPLEHKLGQSLNTRICVVL